MGYRDTVSTEVVDAVVEEYKKDEFSHYFQDWVLHKHDIKEETLSGSGYSGDRTIQYCSLCNFFVKKIKTGHETHLLRCKCNRCSDCNCASCVKRSNLTEVLKDADSKLREAKRVSEDHSRKWNEIQNLLEVSNTQLKDASREYEMAMKYIRDSPWNSVYDLEKKIEEEN